MKSISKVFECSLHVVKFAFTTGGTKLEVAVTLKNITDKTISVYDQDLDLERSDFLKVRSVRTNKSVPYSGNMVKKRRSPNAKLVRILPGASVTTTVDVTGYDLTKSMPAAIKCNFLIGYYIGKATADNDVELAKCTSEEIVLEIKNIRN